MVMRQCEVYVLTFVNHPRYLNSCGMGPQFLNIVYRSIKLILSCERLNPIDVHNVEMPGCSNSQSEAEWILRAWAWGTLIARKLFCGYGYLFSSPLQS
jgi:hypothetical protein